MNDRWVAVHPAVLAFSAAVADRVSSRGGAHSGTVHKIGSLPYLIRMGLFDYVKLDPGQRIHEHEAAGRFIPIQRIRTNDDLSRFIVDMIPLLHAAPEDVEPIRYVISELVRSVLEHSLSGGGALLAAQYFRNSATLALGVCDAGVGVRATLERFHTVPTHWEALVQALRPGVSGASPRLGGNAYNAGAGLFFTKSIACASRNYFVLYSGDAMFKLKPLPQDRPIQLFANPARDHHTKEVDLPEWGGTLVGIDVSLGDTTTFGALMNLIRSVFGETMRAERKKKIVQPRFT